MGATPKVQGLTGSGNPSGKCGTDMVGVDLKSDTIIFFRINNQGRGNTSDGLSQGHGCTAMQKTVGLPRPVIDRHLCLQPGIPRGCKLNTDIFHHVSFPPPADVFQCQMLFKPNTHYSYRFKDRMTASGRKGDASPPFFRISRTIVEATEVYLGSPVKKTVSIFLFS